ncbi:hypothetical protein CA238_02590 [Sphingomonas koreensis]|uniref:Uncharacterized protein n=1 Tax=Sphingomonas koreensis TaxID=93064 RepID=A0AAJ4VB96_9SPHN|nr:hypothetical protein CA224_06175 [Sphingomonas koreensis]RSU26819.1 hypothetical protein CA225_12565 [Sphingomonas koreensis]RSU39411.1 hypothetical protein BRX39_02080 [Sphingomonas koreensis]RSU40556.1 hypothetical protein BRX38_11860 [Sphingomonas koreensis]RSU47995.1 hypothetical protein CA221_17000 [Sphingomonas koreensis]
MRCNPSRVPSTWRRSAVPRSGPIVIAIEHRIAEANVAEFLCAMSEEQPAAASFARASAAQGAALINLNRFPPISSYKYRSPSTSMTSSVSLS